MLKTYSRSQLTPTNKIAAGITILIHQKRKRVKGFAPPSDSSFKDSDLLIHQAAVMTARSEPKACMPEPKILIVPTNVLFFILLGMQRF